MSTVYLPRFIWLAAFCALLIALLVAWSPPFATLPDQTLLEIDFAIICTPAAGESRTAVVGFSTLPRPSFSNPNGQDVAGSNQDGLVTVVGSDVATATATPTATATATTMPAASAFYCLPVVLRDGGVKVENGR